MKSVTHATNTQSPSNYIAKHRLLLTKYDLHSSVARHMLYYSDKFHVLKYSRPHAIANCFLLEYSAATFNLRVTTNNVIIVDGIPYTVVFRGCTPATIRKNEIAVSASFRRFHNDFGLPAVVIIYPSKQYNDSIESN